MADPWIVMVVVMGALVGLHLLATNATGTLDDPVRARLAVTPETTLTQWWHHLWAGFFHHSWGHLAYNLAVFALAFPLAARQQGALVTLGNAYWIGPFTVFALHLLLVLPLAAAGAPYAVRALNYPLVGFSVMAYSIAGMAMTAASVPFTVAAVLALVIFETAMALYVTGPFIAVYHLAGFGLGFWVRTLLR